MQRKAVRDNQTAKPSRRLNPIKNSIVTLILSLLPLSLSISPAEALRAQIGVVKSPENAQQWNAITNRLRTAGLSYCILEQSTWQTSSDLNNFSILFLPNVENINGSQAIALKEWMNQGGQIIVTGPTGTLSQPEVKTQLKSLLGGYWGFVNSAPATLNLVEDPPAGLKQDKGGLSSTLVGGVIIPTGVDSQTAAVWLSEGSPPAVIMTDRSTFLGWRWGEDQVASPNLDVAWLEASLKRYGIKSYPLSNSSDPQPCNPNNNNNQPSTPILPQWEQQSSQPDTKGVVSNNQEQSFPLPNIPSNGLTNPEIQNMTQELQDLIARVESTLLAAEATQSNLVLPAHKVVEESLKNQRSHQTPTPRIHNKGSYQAVMEAKESLKTFQQLIQNQQYTEARRLWLKARRNLWDNYPTDVQFAQSEIRAMWLDRGTIVQAKSEADLAQVFDRMADAGINVVFFETINASYPIYPSKIAPEQNPLTQGWDPLKAAIKLAHERNMEIHAWTWIFAAANQRHNEVLNLPLDYLGPVLSRNPDWAITNKDGNPFDYGQGYKKAFFDPANPAVQRYLLSLLEEIVMNYDVDGVQFDYIRYPFQAPNKKEIMGYSNSSRWLFKEMTGTDPIEIEPGDPLWDRWTAFRVQQVDSFVANASARLKQRRPNLIISAAVFPMEQQERFYRLQQNWEEWGKNDWVDVIYLMTYALDTGSFEDRVKPLSQRGVAGASLVIPGLRLLKVPDPVTLDQMQLVRNMPTSGFALFATENLTPNLQEIFNRTQGAVNGQIKDPLPYRQPFQAASARYEALKREWSFLLANRQLAMDEGTMKQWSRYIDGLANNFAQLAQNPTRSNFNATKLALTQFRQQFPNWMSQQRRNSPYQVQVWQNRLETLDGLLNYGERFVFVQNRTSH